MEAGRVKDDILRGCAKIEGLDGIARQPVCRRLQGQASLRRHWRRAGPETDHLSAVRPDALVEREFANRKAGLLTRLFLFENLARSCSGSSGVGKHRTAPDTMTFAEGLPQHRLECGWNHV